MIGRIAIRNVVRHRRRTAATMLTVMIGAAATITFAAFMLFSRYGLQTEVVRANGHLVVYNRGYFTFGSGSPVEWGMYDYQQLLRTIRTDPVLAPMLEIATPIQVVSGIIASTETDRSQTFFGVGFVPSERDVVRAWNAYGTDSSIGTSSKLDDDATSDALVGTGLARTLGLCDRLHLADCPPNQRPPDRPHPEADETLRKDFSSFEEYHAASGSTDHEQPTVQVLGSTVSGAPNVINLNLARAEFQGVKAVDDNFVGLNLAAAQRLVYGGQPPGVTGIVILLHRTDQIGAARERLGKLFSRLGDKHEVRDFTELSPFYLQTVRLYDGIFEFIASIIGLVVVFSVGNAVTMSVVERTVEIGTQRALGTRRSAIAWQFVVEGTIIGIAGAAGGVAFAYVIAFVVNRSGLNWMPPGNAHLVPVRLYMGDGEVAALVWLALVILTVLTSVAPAIRASRLSIVEALRHH